MNCAAFESILADYIDGTLSNAERAAVEQHAAVCSGCGEFLAEAIAGSNFLREAEKVDAPAELITRIAYLAPAERYREPFEKQGLFSRAVSAWLRPILQPRLAMGMAMTILSFAMLERCTGIQVQRIQASDLSPLRVWSGVEGKALRVKDQVAKYYDNLRVVYEIETHIRDLQEQQDANDRVPSRAAPKTLSKSRTDGSGRSERSDPKSESGSKQ